MALYMLARLTSAFSLLGLVFAVVVLAFSLPKVYELRKDQIDAGVDAARKQTTQLYDTYLHSIVSKIPKASNAKPAESSTAKKAE